MLFRADFTGRGSAGWRDGRDAEGWVLLAVSHDHQPHFSSIPSLFMRAVRN